MCQYELDKKMKAPGYVVVLSWADVKALSATPIFSLSPDTGKETLPLILSSFPFLFVGPLVSHSIPLVYL